MAWHEITYECGHEGRVQIYGPHKSRDGIAAAMGRQPCRACWEEARKEKSEQARESAVETGLVGLVGSEKQVAWAERIRADRLAESARIRAGLQLWQDHHPDAREESTVEQVWGAYQEWHALLLEISSAKWWIDTRASSLSGAYATGRRVLGRVLDSDTYDTLGNLLWATVHDGEERARRLVGTVNT